MYISSYKGEGYNIQIIKYTGGGVVLLKAEDGIGSPEHGVPGGCELPNMGTRN